MSMVFLERPCPVCGLLAKGICSVCFSGFRAPTEVALLEYVDKYMPMFDYNGNFRKAILAGKQAGRVDVIKQLAKLFGHFLLANLDLKGTEVTWVPASKFAKRRRGFDQGKVIASSVVKGSDMRMARYLVRESHVSQTGKGRFHRLLGPKFRVIGEPPKTLLIVDDVVTTGASINAAANVFRKAGCTKIYAASLAYVQPR